MKTIIAIFFALASMTAFGQGIRVDTQVTTIATAPPQGSNAPLFGVPNAAITLCGYPANGVPCTNYATSYTDNTEAVACAQAAPVVLNGTNTCVQTADAGGNFGVWVAPGAYSYMITTTTGSTYGPFYFTAGNGGSLSGFLPLSGGTLTGPLNLASGTPSGQNAVSFNYVSANYCNLGTSGCALTGMLSGPDAVFTNSLEKKFVPNANIASAFTNAGSTGSVLIPANYGGTDGWTTNPNGVQVEDDRPLSATRRPITTVNAAQYGAQCNGLVDDTLAIQSAINATYAYNILINAPTQFVVELPSGTCIVSRPLVFGVYGSLQGQGGSTFLLAEFNNWVGTNYNVIQITASAALPGGNTSSPRVFGHMTIFGLGNSSIPNSQAVQIINTANVYAQEYQFGQTSFEDMAVANLDTGFDLQDAVNTQFHFVWVSEVRVAANLNGNVIQTFFDHTYFQVGSSIGTSTHTTAYGLIVQPNNKYSANCSTHTQYCAPQGVFFHHSSIVSFDYNLDVEQCTQCEFDHNTIDVPANGITGSGADIELGGFALGGGLWIESNYMGAEKQNTFIVNSVATSSGSGIDGLWINNNHIFSSAAGGPGSTNGIVMAGSGSIEAVHINGNTFGGLNQGIVSSQSLLYSEIRGNMGRDNATRLINLVNGGTPDYTGTVVDGNTENNSIPVLSYSGATNLQVGFNRSPAQITGTFTAHGTGCTFSAGTVGTSCTVTMSMDTPFPDAGYVITGCVVVGASTQNYISTVGPFTVGSVFPVAESATNISSTGGGTVECGVRHY